MLKSQIEQQIKEALKAGDRRLVETLRFLISAVKNAEIDSRRDATDEDVVMVVQKQVKQHRESIEAFKSAGRDDLFQAEQAQLEILQGFLPRQLSEEEVRVIVQDTVSLLPEEEKNFGKVMGIIMGKVKGKAGGDLVSKIVKESL
ncbi:glutamyl-tRNA amidotransferase [Candidatus Shapirobacteria bacterium CG03_land_8_20_14_0_80_40_19]|uniref:Glutamyl-tRNA amidotransferase n=4 Tax=Candidatus Shapironibacteriota TaxID=1752721 RepID=A0A2M7BEY5_9BACT|nr:MAG: glutamyl-tRNA amidotransferase [Candidatus Shapirobacteria bacterium CG11_big_fil_rev_8_21_14_0_20_40_12]PIV01639.1 MAG: glutamyl-tRNA amidotransferase [Candidatus Shapirobacteria bacterium CG03_land_8_20_14_0_80_40_19]PJC28877.1 MAG: glutamyl-tRNA amidotransferase [Candidatus Shapirobacteria bacterium CG_4_9_14_0_2_um_filter_40_11]PJC76354.1 MAG: glutamyl-tRNA amidotransferase [Candidatus Shapirobacteria bacterium CG_4_8_14_3_um_filter_39_11]